MTLSKIRWELRALLVPLLFCGVVATFCAKRGVVYFWYGTEERDEAGKWKREWKSLVAWQGVWAGVLAGSAFCALFLSVPNGNKF